MDDAGIRFCPFEWFASKENAPILIPLSEKQEIQQIKYNIIIITIATMYEH